LNPIERSGRNRQLEIETGTMEDICELIKKDWALMNEDNRKLREDLDHTIKRLKDAQAEIVSRNKKYTD
jgi:hypothetical protein